MVKSSDFDSENSGSSPDAAAKIVADYDALVERAIEITNDIPFYASVDYNDRPRLSFDGDDAVLNWREYESDYYGGGSTIDESTRFPAYILFMSDDELSKLRAKTKKDVAEQERRVKAAQEAVARDRAELNDRADFARLQKKYGVKA